jgi:hypothetical protein
MDILEEVLYLARAVGCAAGMDVDKLDYFKRDCRNCRVDVSSGWDELMIDDARVFPAMVREVEDDPTTPIGKHYLVCFPARSVPNVSEWFKTRFRCVRPGPRCAQLMAEGCLETRRILLAEEG